MILVDANLLIYAINRDAPAHRAARSWWESALSGSEGVGLPWIVVLAFLRITTRHGILERPLTADAAIQFVDDWLAQPVVEMVLPRATHWATLRNLLLASGTGGNLTSDAHIAALAMELGATIYSADYDFRRFAGVSHRNPLEAGRQPSNMGSR
ncbi:type II toxin-antitoxin system VapC family toxin [Pseudohaliea sp.]|uniref:type II toxin-antitoxin system VapC family toxin n=1 Tax=Pseudohaliea sp. TaxID=2740289 RepID=UPI0032EAE047